MNIRERVFDKSALYSPGNGRDYLKTPEGEIFSINGLYCDADGTVNRYGQHVKVIDVRWSPVIWQDCSVGLDADFNTKWERRLIFTGDNRDEEILARYGYRVERDADGYKNILPLTQEGK
jgi:hypothetical protein